MYVCVCVVVTQVSKSNVGLLDPTYVWILPQYEDLYWWELNNTSLSEPYQDCNNSDMLSLLNSINLLTVDSLKYNLFGGSGDGYHGYVLVRGGVFHSGAYLCLF